MKNLCIISLLAITLILTACESQADRINRLILQLAGPDPSVQTQAYDELAAIGAPAEGPLINALDTSSNSKVRCGAAWALGQIGDAGALAPLTAALKDPDEDVVQYAEGALVYIGAPAVGPLMTAMGGTDSQTMIAAAAVLGQIGDASAVAPLINALQDGNTLLRQTAVIALENLRDSRSVGPLIALFKDNDEGVRLAALEALVNIGAPAVGPLISTLDDSVSYVILEDGALLEIRQEAALALGRIGDTRAIQPLINSLADNDPVFRWDVASALGLMGTPAVGPLISQLNSPDPRLVRGSAQALGLVRDARAVEPLISLVQNGETSNGLVAYQALAAMGDAAQPRLQNFLLDALQAQDLKTIAACYDFYILRGDPAAEPALIAAMNFYADAYGNFDNNEMVPIAERFLNCGNDNLHAAAIGWGEGHAFQVIATPCPQVSSIWGPDVYDAYCGPGMVTWGNMPLNPDVVYVLWRGINDIPEAYDVFGSSLYGRSGGAGSHRSFSGPVGRIVYGAGSLYNPPGYHGRQPPDCPNVTWKIDTLTNSPGLTGLPVVNTGDIALWKITITNGNPPVRADIRIKTAVDGAQIDVRDIALLGQQAALWVPSRGWNTGDEGKLHTVIFELDYGGVKCDSQTYRFPVVKRPLQPPQPITRPNWLRPRLIDGWQRTDATPAAISPVPVNPAPTNPAPVK